MAVCVEGHFCSSNFVGEMAVLMACQEEMAVLKERWQFWSDGILVTF